MINIYFHTRMCVLSFCNKSLFVLTLQFMHVDDIFYKAKYASMFQIIIYLFYVWLLAIFTYYYKHKRSDQ